MTASSKPSLYQALVAAGIPVSNHCSDLYFQWTDESRAIRKQYPEIKRCSLFTSQDPADNKATWCDAPFQFDPFWEKVWNKAHRLADTRELKGS